MRFFVPLVGLNLGLLTYLRIFYGVDYLDEAFYLAIPYRFTLGDLPFIHEAELQQTASLLLYPFVRLYLWWQGSTDGIMLFSRHLYIAFMLGVTGAVYYGIRPFLCRSSSMAIALIAFVFVPFSIPNLSYSALGYGFLSMGLFLRFRHSMEEERQALLVIAGFFEGLGALAYVPLAIVLPLVNVLTCVQSKTKWRTLGLGSLGPLSIGVAFLSLISFSDVLSSVAYMNSIYRKVQEGKVSYILRDLMSWSVFRWSIGVSLLYWVIERRAFRQRHALIALFLLLIGVLHFRGGALTLSIGLAVFSGLFVLPRFRDENLKRLSIYIIIPSIVAGFVMAFSSSVWTIAGGHGWFPCALAGIVAFALILKRDSSALPSSFGLLPILICLLFVLTQRDVFRGDLIKNLTARIEQGPFQGIYGAPEQARFLKELSQHLDPLRDQRGQLLILGDFPAGYLYTSLRPATLGVWSIDHLKPTWYAERAEKGNYALHVKNVWNASWWIQKGEGDKNPALRDFVRSTHELVSETENFALYRMD